MAEPERISISRDALRAELAQLELRLVQSLASKSEVERLVTRVENLEERTVKRDGPLVEELHKASNAIETLKREALTTQDVEGSISDALQHQEARGWTTKERLMGLVLFGITAANFFLQVRGGPG